MNRQPELEELLKEQARLQWLIEKKEQEVKQLKDQLKKVQ